MFTLEWQSLDNGKVVAELTYNRPKGPGNFNHTMGTLYFDRLDCWSNFIASLGENYTLVEVFHLLPKQEVGES